MLPFCGSRKDFMLPSGWRRPCGTAVGDQQHGDCCSAADGPPAADADRSQDSIGAAQSRAQLPESAGSPCAGRRHDWQLVLWRPAGPRSIIGQLLAEFSHRSLVGSIDNYIVNRQAEIAGGQLQQWHTAERQQCLGTSQVAGKKAASFAGRQNKGADLGHGSLNWGGALKRADNVPRPIQGVSFVLARLQDWHPGQYQDGTEKWSCR